MTGARHPHFIASTLLAAILVAAAGALVWIVKPVSGQDIPPEASVRGVIGHAQTYILSCESRSAADWAAFFGYNFTEYDILAALPRSDNPETGFVGSPSGAYGFIPPHSYGVHPPPLAKVLQEDGIPAEAVSGYGWEALQKQIAAGRPVIVWIIGQMWSGTPIRYTASDGQMTTVAYYEHTMIFVGYSEDSVHVVDAYTGNDQYYDINTFLTSWAVLGERAIIFTGNVEITPTQPAGPAGSYTVERGDTLTELAERNGISWVDLANLNSISYPYLLYAGQVIKIPGVEGAQPAETEVPAATPEPTETIPPPSPTPTPSQEQAGTQYIIKAGDTLQDLADQSGVDWQVVVQMNGLSYPYFIYPGQTLILPEVQASLAATPTASEETQPTAAGTPLPADSLYTVQKGDYLADLGQRFGLDWRDLAELNSISYPYRIYPGQVLRLR